ncbi:hypothetical protein [Oxynema aestuarii]|uniref:Uncharacterized protein n=1 Tax=Oxynema aestuarii AP17 TaxID=2064643 RepID=A0A6H1U4N2_9CYAN|nr:hypothetical protein [Oxynema aestuarii]QIZ72993.1 hypothetical protein HCG48_22285 [Oxynema aestuarii AP17]
MMTGRECITSRRARRRGFEFLKHCAIVLGANRERYFKAAERSAGFAFMMI